MIKRVVFVLLLCLLGTASKVSASSTEVYQFGEYEIRATLTREDSALGYDLVKVGTNPFSRRLIYSDTTIHINDIVDIDGYHVLYGYQHVDGQEGYYDGFLTVLSPTGEEIIHSVFDAGYEEDVRGVYTVGTVIMVTVRSSEMNEEEQYDFLQWTIRALDYQYQTLEERVVIDEVDTIIATDSLLLLDKDNDGIYDVAFDETLTPIRADDPLPITTDQVFEGEVSIPFLNTARLNQVEYHNGVYIQYPGEYSLEYDQFNYQFTVVPIVSGVEDGAVYNRSVVPLISAGQTLLNGDLFVSGTEISEPGTYDLTIKGMGGYRQTIAFTITSNLDGIYHNGEYSTPVEITFDGIGYLNNQFIPSPYTISEPGEYVLSIRGQNHYDENYFFTITENEDGKTLVDFLKQYDLYILGVTLVSGFLIIKKK